MAVSIPAFVPLQGVVLGLNYGLLAMGLVLLYRTNRVLNFAQGQVGVVGAVFLVKAYADFHFNYWFSLLLALGLSAALGALSELVVIRRLFNRPRVLVMVATVGLSLVLLFFTTLPFILPKHLSNAFPVPIHTSFTIDGFVFGPGAVLTLIVAPIVAVAFAAFVRFSPWGLAMRAMSENADSARLSGVWVRRTSTLAWTLAGVLSAFTEILASPGQASVLTQPLSPDLLLFALTAALIGAMVNLTVAFIAGIGVGIFFEILTWNISSTASVQTIMFALLLVVLLVRVAALKKGARTEERSTWQLGSSVIRRAESSLRQRVGTTGVLAITLATVALPLLVSTGDSFLLSQVAIYAVVALSLTVLTGWAGQVSLGQFGLVAVGTIIASHLGTSVPLPLEMLLAGAVTAVIAVIVGLPALRVRGLYLAVSTLAFALWMQVSVLATPCFTVPLVGKQVCTGLPNPASTLIGRPTLFGISLGSERAFAWFSVGLMVLSVLMVRVWRDRGIARRLISVRDNEIGAAAMGIPVVRTKLLAFALSGFMAGYAGVALAFATERFSTTTFDPAVSITVISMVIIGGLGSIPGAIIGAVYLIGLPGLFGANGTIDFLASGLGLVAIILYLPAGLADVMHRLGDLATVGVERLLQRVHPTAGPDGADEPELPRGLPTPVGGPLP